MITRTLGTNGLEVSAIGLGCMGLNHGYVTIDGGIGGGDARFAPDALAGLHLDLHQQPSTEWVDELLVN
jgi:hypothetical protein